MDVVRTTLIAALLSASSACTIEGTKALGDECVQSRECADAATHLACLPDPNGRYRCMPAVSVTLPGDSGRATDAIAVDALDVADAANDDSVEDVATDSASE